jgi:hypothetical protein
VNNLGTSPIINAEGNYWSHPSGPFDNANTDGLGLLNPGGLGERVSEYVDWGPFVSADPTGGEAPVYLAISRSGNQAIVSWPNSADGYRLQSITNLPAASNVWTAVTIDPSIIGGRYTVTDSLSGNRKFYRLIK